MSFGAPGFSGFGTFVVLDLGRVEAGYVGSRS